MARSPSKSRSKGKNTPSKKRPSTSVGPSGDKKPKVPRDRHIVRLPGPTKAYADENDYRLIQLPNGIRALLISGQGQDSYPDWHHQTADLGVSNLVRMSMNDENLSPNLWSHRRVSHWKSPAHLKDCLRRRSMRRGRNIGHAGAFAITVNVGWTNDPLDHYGLTHFCEHIVLFGSKGYPAEDELLKYLNENGGNGLSASTCQHTTTFYFETTETNIAKGLDIFSNMIALFPAFEEDLIGREVNAVDNEFLLKRHLDAYRADQILFSIANKNHPLHKFSCGTLQTLRHPEDPNGLGKLQTALRSHHKTHYVGSAITLSLQTSASLDEMENMVFDNFSKIPEGQREIRQYFEVGKGLDRPFDNPNFNNIYLIKGRQNMRAIRMTWAFPAEAWKDSKNKPLDFLGVLMNDEWAGGLPYYLRKQGWIFDYSAGCGYQQFYRNEYTSLFEIGISATAEGMKNYFELIQVIFAFIKRIEEIPLAQKQKLWTEMHCSTSKFFNFSGPGDPSPLTVNSSMSLQIQPGTDIFCVEKCYGPTYDDSAFMKHLTLMTPNSVNVMMILPEGDPLRKEMKFPKSEPFTGAEYAVQKFSAPLMKSMKTVKSLDVKCIMPKNPFVNGTVVNVGFIKASRIAETEKFSIHHHGNKSNSVFKARCTVQFASGVCNNIRNSLYLILLGECLQLKLIGDVSSFQRSGSNIRIYVEDSGLCFDVCGFPKAMHLALSDLLPKVFNSARNFIGEAVFDLIKRDSLDEWAERKQNNTDILDRMIYELETPNAASWEDDQRILESLNYKGFLSFVQLFKSSSFAIVEIEGNMSIQDGLNVAWILEDLNYNPTVGNWKNPTIGMNELDSLPDNRCIRVRNPSPDDPNTVVFNMYDLGHKRDAKIVGIGIFLGSYIPPLMFHMLRTERQLGYAVDSEVDFLLDSVVLILSVTFPSDKRTACEVDQAMDGFLLFLVNVYHRHLKTLTNAAFLIWKKKMNPENGVKAAFFGFMPHDLLQQTLQNLGLPDSLTLGAVHSWYTNNILAVIKLNKNKGQGEWRDDNFTMIRKLSIQILGSTKERCAGIKTCTESEETSASDTSLIFAKDGKNAIRPYFISNIQDYKRSPDE